LPVLGKVAVVSAVWTSVATGVGSVVASECGSGGRSPGGPAGSLIPSTLPTDAIRSVCRSEEDAVNVACPSLRREGPQAISALNTIGVSRPLVMVTGEQPCVWFSKLAGIAAINKSACAYLANLRARKPAPSDGKQP